MKEKADFFIFGATSELARRLFAEERERFEPVVRRLVLVQRGPEKSPEYQAFDSVVARANAENPAVFRADLNAIVGGYASAEHPQHVLSTYGAFNVHDGDLSRLRFAFTDEGFQINLNSRLQIIDAFSRFKKTTRFHLLGSLLGSFPYTGDYATSMWFVNQLPRHPAYAELDLRVYNLGGLKTRFWDHASGPRNNPFLHSEIPTAWLRRRMLSDKRGVFDIYPSVPARIAIALARCGARLL
ncbi:MAG: hypothetical protein ACOYKM_12475 [Caulobacterales bacterium]